MKGMSVKFLFALVIVIILLLVFYFIIFMWGKPITAKAIDAIPQAFCQLLNKIFPKIITKC